MNTIKFIPGIHPAFKQQFDKLTRAYINNEIKPLNGCACFVGNLLNNCRDWSLCRGCWYGIITKDEENYCIGSRVIEDQSNGLYTPEEIIALENEFMKMHGNLTNSYYLDEDVLFESFSKTLETLRNLHISKGEIIDEEPILKKRELVTI